MSLLNERRKRPLPLASVPPPTYPPRRLTCASPGDEYDGERSRLEAEEKAWEEAECAMGCDYPDGPLSPQGYAW